MSTVGVIDSDGEMRCMKCNKMGWCEHIKEYIALQLDKESLHPDMLVLVPLFPTFSLFTTVRIADESYPGVALMEIEHSPDFGALRRVALGFWNEGEGRLSMRKVIIDWLKSRYPAGRADLSCPSTTHKFPQVKELGKQLDLGVKYLWPNAWAMLMEGACLPCIELSTDPDDVPDVGAAAPWQGNK